MQRFIAMLVSLLQRLVDKYIPEKSHSDLGKLSIHMLLSWKILLKKLFIGDMIMSSAEYRIGHFWSPLVFLWNISSFSPLFACHQSYPLVLSAVWIVLSYPSRTYKILKLNIHLWSFWELIIFWWSQSHSLFALYFK